MEQRDYIKRQIEQIGAMISYMLKLLSGSGPDSGSRTEAVRQTLLEELDLDIYDMVEDGPEKVLETLKSKGMDYGLLVRFCSFLDSLSGTMPSEDPMRDRIAAFSADLNRQVQKTYSIAEFSFFQE